jgi:hypothetical protein
MQAQGLVQEKNLGQVVSQFTHQPPLSSTPSEVVITTGSGHTVVVGGTGTSTGSVSAGKATQGKHGQEVSAPTASPTVAGPQGLVWGNPAMAGATASKVRGERTPRVGK